MLAWAKWKVVKNYYLNNEIQKIRINFIIFNIKITFKKST